MNERKTSLCRRYFFFFLSFSIQRSVCVFFHSNVCDAHTSEFYDSFFSHFFLAIESSLCIVSLTHTLMNIWKLWSVLWCVCCTHTHTHIRVHKCTTLQTVHNVYTEILQQNLIGGEQVMLATSFNSFNAALHFHNGTQAHTQRRRNTKSRLGISHSLCWQLSLASSLLLWWMIGAGMYGFLLLFLDTFSTI